MKALFLLAMLAPGLIAAAPEGAPATGPYTAVFERRSPMSDPASVAARHSWTLLSEHKNYDLADERFSVYVPPGYTGDEPYGVIVWISPGPRGGPPPPWRAVLDEHKLIWIGADNAGNGREIWHRLGLPLDALHNLCQTHNVDPMRIYVAGFSGGARCAGRMAINYPELFSGAISIGGIDYYRQIDPPEPRPKSWYRVFTRPHKRHVQLAKTYSRFVLITGDRDFNQPQMKVIHEAMADDGFEHVSYVEAPGMGHQLPGGDEFERAVAFLDRIPEPTPRQSKRIDIAQGKLDEALALIESDPEKGLRGLKQVANRFTDTPAGRRAWFDAHYRYASVEAAPQTQPAGDETAEAQQALQLAEAFIKIEEYGQARKYLTEVLKKHPDTPQAVIAFKLLRKLPGTEVE